MIYSFGSLNMDLVAQAPRLPVPGETILGTQFQTVPGGKGANQAVAAARLGAQTAMVGRVGDDAFSHSLLASLKTDGIDTHLVKVDATVATGIASIVVDGAGNNHIVVVPGANGQVGEADAHALAQIIQPGDIVLMQLEVPLAAVFAAATLAHSRGARVILDPAPAQVALPDSLFRLVDTLTPNQIEASQLVGFPVTDVTTALQAAQRLRHQGANRVIVKLGADGVVVAAAETYFHQPAMVVEAIDTVAAGDAFNGGLAVGLGEGMPLVDAVQLATAVAAYSVTQRGAQGAMPSRSQVQTFLDSGSVPAPVALDRG
jgi:ribokinase